MGLFAQLLTQIVNYQFAPAGDIDLAEDIAQMILHRLFSDEQRFADRHVWSRWATK
jgi:DNA-directed RNA polymerase specialized sigma24 family protein